MEPEERLDGHMNGGRQVVAAAHVAEFMSEYRVQLRRIETLPNSFR
jgi:hypothetical protein